MNKPNETMDEETQLVAFLQRDHPGWFVGVGCQTNFFLQFLGCFRSKSLASKILKNHTRDVLGKSIVLLVISLLSETMHVYHELVESSSHCSFLWDFELGLRLVRWLDVAWCQASGWVCSKQRRAGRRGPKWYPSMRDQCPSSSIMRITLCRLWAQSMVIADWSPDRSRSPGAEPLCPLLTARRDHFERADPG